MTLVGNTVQSRNYLIMNYLPNRNHYKSLKYRFCCADKVEGRASRQPSRVVRISQPACTASICTADVILNRCWTDCWRSFLLSLLQAPGARLRPPAAAPPHRLRRGEDSGGRRDHSHTAPDCFQTVGSSMASTKKKQRAFLYAVLFLSFIG